MTSEVSISNSTLASLGEKAFIQSMTEASVQARYCNLLYDTARKATLRAHPWNFARTRKALALLSDTAVGKYQYTYALPTGCLRARYIESMLGLTIPFEVALSEDGNSKILYTNQVDAVLVYTANVTNPDLFDALFTDAFTYNLGFRLAPTLAPSKAQEMATKYVNAMRVAQAVDASEGEPEPPSAPDWVEARLGGGSVEDELFALRRSLS